MSYKLLPEDKEPSTLAKDIVETTARSPLVASAPIVAAGRSGLGAGNIFSAINSYVAAPISKAITGKEAVPYEKTAVGKLLPTYQQSLKDIHQTFPSTKPRNKVESFVQSSVGDAANLFGVGKAAGMGKYALGPVRSMGISLAANLGGESTKQFTGDEGKSDAVKNGIMLGLSLYNPTSANQIAGGLYDKAKSILPQGATVSASRLENGLNSLENTILGGRPLNAASPSEKWVIDQINKVRSLVNNGTASVDQLVKQKKSLNEELQKFVYETTDRNARNHTRKLATKINGEIRETMKEYGNTNPDWWKYQSEGDKAYGAIAQSNFISRVLEKFMKGRPEVLAHVFGVGAPVGLGFVSGIGGGILAAGYQAAKLITRIWNSKELGKHYAKVVGAAAAENPQLINGELDRLQKELESEKEKSKSTYRLLPD